MRIIRLDQVDFPLPMPALQLLLARDGAGHIGEELVTDEAVDRVSAGEAGGGTVSVLPQAGDKIGGYADIQRAIVPAGEDVGAGLALVSHASVTAARWTLERSHGLSVKQVQGDGFFERAFAYD